MNEAQIRNTKHITRNKFNFKIHKDDRENPAMFLRHLCVLFPRAGRMWFEKLHNEFPKPYYFALPRIEKEDPEHHDKLEALASFDSSAEEKIKAADWIYNRLFT